MHWQLRILFIQRKSMIPYNISSDMSVIVSFGVHLFFFFVCIGSAISMVVRYLRFCVPVVIFTFLLLFIPWSSCMLIVSICAVFVPCGDRSGFCWLLFWTLSCTYSTARALVCVLNFCQIIVYGLRWVVYTCIFVRECGCNIC